MIGINHDEQQGNDSTDEIINSIYWEEYPHFDGDSELAENIGDMEYLILRGVASRYADLRGADGTPGVIAAVNAAGICTYEGDQVFEFYRHDHSKEVPLWQRFLNLFVP